MPAFSNANDKTAITAIRVKILFFLIKSIMHINNLFIKFLYKIINIVDKNLGLKRKKLLISIITFFILISIN